MLRIGKLEKQHPPASPLDRRDQLFNSLCVYPRRGAWILRVKLLKCTICINVAVKITGWLLEQMADGERDLCMAERCMKPILVSRYSGPDWPKKQRIGVVAPRISLDQGGIRCSG